MILYKSETHLFQSQCVSSSLLALILLSSQMLFELSGIFPVLVLFIFPAQETYLTYYRLTISFDVDW